MGVRMRRPLPSWACLLIGRLAKIGTSDGGGTPCGIGAIEPVGHCPSTGAGAGAIQITNHRRGPREPAGRQDDTSAVEVELEGRAINQEAEIVELWERNASFALVAAGRYGLQEAQACLAVCPEKFEIIIEAHVQARARNAFELNVAAMLSEERARMWTDGNLEGMQDADLADWLLNELAILRTCELSGKRKAVSPLATPSRHIAAGFWLAQQA